MYALSNAGVQELQDVKESMILASKTALPTVFSKNTSPMIRCSQKLIEYEIVKNISNAVYLWGIEVLSAQITPFKFGSGAKAENREDTITKCVNFIQKLAGHNPLPVKEKFTVTKMIDALRPYLTESVCSKVNAVVLLVLKGENGGKCLVDFKTGSMVANPASCHPDVTVTLEIETLISMIDNRNSLIDEYKKGKVEIEGDMEIARKLHAFI